MGALPLSLKELAKKLKVEYSGNGDLIITHVCGLDSLQAGGLAYLSSPGGITSVPTPAGMSRQVSTTVDEINSSQVALVVSPEVQHPEHNLLISADPLATHVAATKLLNPEAPRIPGLSKKSGIHPSAVVSKRAKLGKNVIVGATAIGLGANRSLSLLSLDKEKGKFTSIGYQYDNGTWVRDDRLDMSQIGKGLGVDDEDIQNYLDRITR